MDLSLSERVAVVETKLDTLQIDMTSAALDVRMIRDHLLTSQGATKSRARALATLVTVSTAGAGFWEAFGTKVKTFLLAH